MSETLQIVEGGYYRNRLGEKIGPMPPEWQLNSTNDRVWANVPKGQLIISQGIHGDWHIDWPLLPESMRSEASVVFWTDWNSNEQRNCFRTMESAKRALTDFYLEQTKERT